MAKHILVTNDDGVFAPGLFALVREMQKLGKVTILAPDRNWSGGGHVKTLDRALRVREIQLADGTQAFASDGARSDCVALATLGYFKEPIDLVVSGVNAGANLGHDVTYSGTVTAAMEAVIAGIPGIAVSLETTDHFLGEIDYGPAARAAAKVVRQVIANGLSHEILLNVNVPFLPEEKVRGILLTRQGCASITAVWTNDRIRAASRTTGLAATPPPASQSGEQMWEHWRGGLRLRHASSARSHGLPRPDRSEYLALG
jgi:5'-nucleotidase